MNTGTAAAPTPYWCFISYRHADNQAQDRAWASWLHQEIERYEVPAELVGQRNPRGDLIPERIYPVFRDEESLPADADLAQSIVLALERSRCLVVLCSPGAVASRYVADEIHHYKRRGGADRIIGAILSGEPGTARECFPEPLRHPLLPSGELDRSQRLEPIAADFRLADGSEGYTSAEAYRLALAQQTAPAVPAAEIERRATQHGARLQLMKLKIIAGILGVPLEQLRNRDQAYQLQLAQQRASTLRRWLSAVGLLAVLALGGGVVAAYKQRQAEQAQARTVREMVDASWKSFTFFTANPNPSFAEQRSYLFGTRSLYHHLRLFMDLRKLQSLSPVPVFLSGPHAGASADDAAPGSATAGDFNFKSYDFGRYNPEFVQWAIANAIPATRDEGLRRLTQPFYDRYLRELCRYYYITYLDLQAAGPRIDDEVIPRFEQDLDTFSSVPFDERGMGTGPGDYLQYTVFADYATQFARYDNARKRWVSIFAWSSGEMDVYHPNVAGPFWVRRRVDGTSEDFATLLRQMLSTYDRAWFTTAPEARPPGEAGARRFVIKF